MKAGYYHAVALTESGEVYSWGYNGYGQLGNGTKDNFSIPQKIEGLSNIVKVDAYKYITIALNADGKVYVCGQGYNATPAELKFNRK